MKLQIVGDNLSLSASQKALIAEKVVEDLERHLEDFDEGVKKAVVRVEKGASWGYKVSFDMWLPEKEHIYAEEKGRDLALALVELREDVERQIEKYKEKLK